MHRLIVLAAVALAPACLWKNRTSDESSRVAMTATVPAADGPRGARLHASTGMAGLYLGAEAEVRDLRLAPRAPDPAPAPPAAPDRREFLGVGANLTLRASPLGILGRDHRLERYFDFGGEAGVGTGAVIWDGDVGEQHHAFVGGWVELGTVSVKRRYLAIVGDVRLLDHGGPWRDEVVATVGLALARRGPARDLRLRD